MSVSSRSSCARISAIASAAVASPADRDVVGVHQAAGRVVLEVEQFLDLGLRRRLHLVEDLLGGLVFELVEHVGGLVGRHLLDDVGGLLRLERLEDAHLHVGIDLRQRLPRHLFVDGLEDRAALVGPEVLDDVGDVGRVQRLEEPVGDVQPESPLRVRLDDVAGGPRDRPRRDRLLRPAHPGGRDDALGDAPEDAPQADVDVAQVQHRVAVGVVRDLERQVAHPDHLAALGVDDLLIEQVADDAQHPLVVVIGREDLVAQEDPRQIDRAHLFGAHRQPRGPRAHEVAIDPRLVDHRHQRRVLDPADDPALQVVHLQADQLGEKEEFHHVTPWPSLVIRAERRKKRLDDDAPASRRPLVECRSMKIEHAAFQVADPPAVAQWYVAHLGLTVKRQQHASPWGCFLADDGDAVMLEFYNNPRVGVPDYAGIDPLVLHLAFKAADVAATRARLLAAGATAVGEIAVTEAGDTVAMLRDPWGMAVQLVMRRNEMI